MENLQKLKETEQHLNNENLVKTVRKDTETDYRLSNFLQIFD